MLGKVLSVLFLSAKILSELLIKLTNLYGYPKFTRIPKLNPYPNLLVSFTDFLNWSVSIPTSRMLSKYAYLLGTINTY